MVRLPRPVAKPGRDSVHTLAQCGTYLEKVAIAPGVRYGLHHTTGAGDGCGCFAPSRWGRVRGRFSPLMACADSVRAGRSELRTRRKPLLLLRLAGLLLLRLATRQLFALLFQLPPRCTRFVPNGH